MTRPTAEEWNTSALPNARRAYLDADLPFEEIADMVVQSAQVHSSCIKPYRDPPMGVPKQTRQVVFGVRIEGNAYDLFYNGPDGLRGRYWQSPEAGDAATRLLIGRLKLRLLAAAQIALPEAKAPAAPMAIADIQASLEAPSAKVWVKEREFGEYLSQPQLLVLRWADNEQKPGSKGTLWRWTPIDTEIEVKGALLDPDGGEHIPAGKLNRARQIHSFGFT